MGRAIVSNSSLQILLKQSPSAADVVAGVFKLTSEERNRLTQFPVGQGLFFAGLNHVHLKIDASPTETELITTSPQQIAAIKASAKAEEGVTTAELFSQYNQELKELEKEKEDSVDNLLDTYVEAIGEPAADTVLPNNGTISPVNVVVTEPVVESPIEPTQITPPIAPQQGLPAQGGIESTTESSDQPVVEPPVKTAETDTQDTSIAVSADDVKIENTTDKSTGELEEAEIRIEH